MSGGSYASSPDPRLHFGLGLSTKIDEVVIHWPSGAEQRITPHKLDMIYNVIEGKDIREIGKASR